MGDSVLQVTHLNVLTHDLERASRFYTELLGFRYVQNLGPEKVVLNAGGFDFFVERVADEVRLNEKFHFGIKLSAERIRALEAELIRHGVKIVKGNNPAPGIYTTPDGQRTALYFEDPDGWVIEAYSAI